MSTHPEGSVADGWRSGIGWIVVGVVAVVVLLVAQPVGLDLKVYREGARIVLDGGLGLYAPMLGPAGDPGLPFTYPPFAAILFIPLALVPFEVAYVLLTAFSVALTHLVGVRVMEQVQGAGYLVRWPSWVLSPVLLVSAPYLDTLTYGQVNVILMGVCVLALSSRRGMGAFGVAVGLAAGVKLTPLALLLLPLMLWKWRTILVAAATFAATQLVGLLVLPRQSLDYWGGVIWDPARVGAVGYIDNLSVRGILVRAGLGSLWWVLAVVVVILLSAAAIRAASGRAPADRLLGYAAGCMLLISPVGWLHHFVWWPVVMVSWAAARGTEAAQPSTVVRVLRRVAVALLVVPLLVSPKILMRTAGLDEESVGYVVGAVLALLPAVGVVLGCVVGIAKGAGITRGRGGRSRRRRGDGRGSRPPNAATSGPRPS